MLIPSLRNLINWRLLALHQLAVFCLVIGARRLWLIRYADLMRGYEKYRADLWKRDEIRVRYISTWEQITELQMWDGKALLVALAVGCALSWLIVTRRRERRAIPLIVFLVSIMLNWHDAYGADWLWTVIRFVLRPLHALSFEVVSGLVGTVFVLLGLLLLLSTWPARRPAAPVHTHA